MTGRAHIYRIVVEWIGDRGVGTAGYRAYGRDHVIRAAGKPAIAGSSDPAFRGDAARWNPEELLIAALSACHKLWYLHLCATAGIVVRSYEDQAEGLMVEDEDGAGRFAEVTLRPRIAVSPGDDLDRAVSLHHEAHARCFIANSVNFPVHCVPEIVHARDLGAAGN